MKQMIGTLITPCGNLEFYYMSDSKRIKARENPSQKFTSTQFRARNRKEAQLKIHKIANMLNWPLILTI